MPPSVAYAKSKSDFPSFFASDDIKLDLIQRHLQALAHIDASKYPGEGRIACFVLSGTWADYSKANFKQKFLIVPIKHI